MHWIGAFDRTATTRLSMAGLALSVLVSSLGISIATIALPALAREFSAPISAVQWVILSYLLAVTVAIVTAGRLGDMFGHRRVLLIGLLIFASASLLCALAPTLAVLIGARAVQGVSAAMLMALPMPIVRETISSERIGSAMGLLGTMSAIGTALGPSLGGLLIELLGWRSVFVALALLCLVTFAAALRYLPNADNQGSLGRGQFDVLGTVVLAATLAAYAIAMTAGKHGFGGINVALLAAAWIGAAVFIRVEAQAVSPLVPLAVLRNSFFAASLVMNVLVSTVMMATLVVGPFFLSFGLGLGEAMVGLVMAVGPFAAALAGVPAGRVTDRFGAATTLLAGLAQMTLGLILLAVLPAMLGVAGYALALIVLTPGFQLFLAANNAAVMLAAQDDQRGMVSGLLGLSRNIGFVSGAAVMGAVFAAAVGARDIADASPQTIAAAFTATFLIAATLVAIAILTALVGRASNAQLRSPGQRPGS
jgi:MFS family permease